MNENTYTHQDLVLLEQLRKEVIIHTDAFCRVIFNPDHITVQFGYEDDQFHDCETLLEAIGTLAGFISGFQLASKLNQL